MSQIIQNALIQLKRRAEQCHLAAFHAVKGTRSKFYWELEYSKACYSIARIQTRHMDSKDIETFKVTI